MGIYIFKREALQKMLEEDERADFGKHLIPSEIKKGKTYAFIYDGYWEDIGTIKSYYLANLALTQNSSSGLKTYDESNPIYTRVNHLPGTKLKCAKVQDSVICEGCILECDEITNSVIGLRSFLQSGTVIRNSIIMGNNFYLPPVHHIHKLPQKFVIGKNCLIEKAIIDEHVWIGDNVRLTNEKGYTSYDGDLVCVREGIIIVSAGTRIPDNFAF